MKINLLAFFGFIVFSCANLYAQTPQQTTDAQEADKLSTEVVRLFKEKKYKEAEPIANRVISVRENNLGKTHILVADAWRNLAYIQLQLKNNKEAEKAFDKAFEVYEKNQPLAPANEKTFVETLEASAYYDALDRNFDKAEKKFLRANEVREKTNGKDSLEIAANLIRLGQIYRIGEDYQKASTFFLRGLEIRKQKLDIYDDKVREAFTETSCVFGKLGRRDELAKISAEIYPRVSDDDAPKIFSSDVPKTSSRPRQIAKGVVNGTAISLPRPVYPSGAQRKGVGGAVNVEVFINESGDVVQACAISGAKELHLISEAAAYKAKFKPTTLSGVPVKVVGLLVYNYVIR